MKAWQMKGFEGVDALTLDEIDPPVPGSGEILLKVHLAALNPADRYLSEGRYPAKPQLPHILGRDGTGEIVELGEGVKEFEVGDVVAVLRSEIGVNRPGMLAEFVAVPEESIARMPQGWDEEEAAGAPLVYLTAYQALTQWGDLKPCVVAITGASGGVGVGSIQLARAMGHTVVALSRSEEKRKRLKELGADYCLDPTDKEWVNQLKKMIAPRRVELAIDNVAGPGFSELIATLGDWGKISVVGREGGTVPEFNTGTLFFRRLRIGGVAVGTYTPAESQQAWKAVVDLLSRTGARPVVDSVFEFKRLREAFARLGKGTGKVLVRCSAD